MTVSFKFKCIISYMLILRNAVVGLHSRHQKNLHYNRRSTMGPVPKHWPGFIYINSEYYYSRPELSLWSLAENWGTYCSLTSLDSGVPIHIYWPASYLEILQWLRGILYFRIKYETKMFPNCLLHSCKGVPCIPVAAL